MLRAAAVLSVLTVVLLAPPATAQPRGVRNAAAGDRRNDMEGGVWEYKVLERTGEKRTMLVGKFRLQGAAAFDVPGSAKGELAGAADVGTLDEGGAFPGGIRPPTAKRLGVLDRVAEGNRGGDRIADVVYEKSRNSTNATPKASFEFDADDKHPLSGEAQVKLDTKHGGGVWRGSYYERTNDGQKRRWNFELRRVEN